MSEVIATAALKESSGFSTLLSSLLAILGYSSAFYFLSLTLKAISVGIAYALWAGVGIVLIWVIGYLRFGQKPDMPAILGIVLITAGVIVINFFSNTVSC